MRHVSDAILSRETQQAGHGTIFPLLRMVTTARLSSQHYFARNAFAALLPDKKYVSSCYAHCADFADARAYFRRRVTAFAFCLMSLPSK